MSPPVIVPPRALLDKWRVAAVHVTSIRGIRVGQLTGVREGKKKKRGYERRRTWVGGEIEGENGPRL